MQSATAPPRANRDNIILNKPRRIAAGSLDAPDSLRSSFCVARDVAFCRSRLRKAPRIREDAPPQRRRSIAKLPASTPTRTPPVEFRTHELQIDGPLAGLRLDQALARALPQYSRARLQSWIEAGAVRVDGQVPRARDKV